MTEKVRKRDSSAPYGPAMLAITPMQRKFVIALYDQPGIPHTRALRLSGWKGSDTACKSRAWVWSHHPKVLAAIEEYGRTEYNSKLPLAVGGVDSILRNPNHRDHVKVLHGLLDRVGINPVNETVVTHRIERSDLLTKIAMLLERHAEFKLPEPAKGLPEPAKVIEAEYSEVADD